MVSRGGKAIQFSETDVRVMGRAAAGVRGMKVAGGDSLIEGCVAGKDDLYVFTVGENGMGKISALEDYREQGRGGSGVKVGATTQKTGHVIGAFTLTDAQKKNGSVILISKDGQTVRVPLADVRITGRTTQGVILAKLKNPKDAFQSATVIDITEIEEESEDTSEEGGV